ncbi:MAG TPA: 30S ribosome-binding factor RbfA [Chitinophagaceae bacterium]|nr:30S ribosome-binding factor RbfA [Chitinophagaceae bacterium]HAN38259.1 30S ribosome-binding factor RbfA [Chitinophagaceae bacterium]
MQEGKRQRQVAGVIQQEMNEIFQRLNLTMIDGGMVSIANVKVTPDLLEARIYLSFFKIEQPKLAMQRINEKASDIKRELAARVRHQLRRIPVLQFYVDDTLEYVFKMEHLFENLKKDDSNNNQA